MLEQHEIGLSYKKFENVEHVSLNRTQYYPADLVREYAENHDITQKETLKHLTGENL